jgi:hypothetical protein
LVLAGCPAGEIAWEAEPEGWSSWHITGVLCGTYHAAFTVDREFLAPGWPHWEQLKWSIIRQVLYKIADDSQPAEDRDVAWKVAPWIEGTHVAAGAKRNAGWYVDDVARSEEELRACADVHDVHGEEELRARADVHDVHGEEETK